MEFNQSGPSFSSFYTFKTYLVEHAVLPRWVYLPVCSGRQYNFVLCVWQRDGTLSAGRSAYINYCGILQQFVQAYISKQKVKNALLS